MGIDVELRAVGTISDADLEAARDFFRTRGMGDMDSTESYDDNLVRISNGVNFATLERFWGPGYERGDWPKIASWILALGAAFPDCKIIYHGDSDDKQDDLRNEMTTERFEEYWAHWLSPHGGDYRASALAWNAAHASP